MTDARKKEIAGLFIYYLKSYSNFIFLSGNTPNNGIDLLAYAKREGYDYKSYCESADEWVGEKFIEKLKKTKKIKMYVQGIEQAGSDNSDTFYYQDIGILRECERIGVVESWMEWSEGKRIGQNTTFEINFANRDMANLFLVLFHLASL